MKKTHLPIRLLSGFIAALLTASSVHADAVIYEPFADSQASLTGNTPGTGLTGTWTATATFVVNSGNLAWGSMPVSGNQVNYSGGAANSTASVGINTTTLTNSGLLNDGSSLWFSMMITSPATGGINADTAFVLSTDTIGGGNGLAMANSGQGVGWEISSDHLKTVTYSGGAKTSGGTGASIATSTTALVAVQVIFGTNGAPDTVKLFLPNTSLTLGSLQDSQTAALSQAAFDTLATGMKSNTVYSFDQIRIAGSYLDSIGMSATSAYWDTNNNTAGAGGATPTGTWDASNTTWNTTAAGNVTSPAAWTPGQTAVFSAGTDATGTYGITVSGTQSIGGIIFEDGTVTISGGVGDKLDLVAAGGAIEVRDVTKTATISTEITQSSGSGALYKEGGGTLVLSGDNTYAGATIVNAGKLILSGNNSAATGGMALNGGVTQFDSLNSINGTTRNVTVNSGAVAMFGTTLSNTDIASVLLGRIVATSAGVVAADNNASGDFNFNTAGLTATYLGAVGTVNYTGTLTPNGNYRLGGAGGTLTMANTNALTGAGKTLTVSGPGTVILAASNNYTGATTVNSGATLVMSASNSSTATTVNAGGTLVVGNANSTGGAGVTLNGTLVIGSSSAFAIGANQIFFSTGAVIRSDSATARSIAGRLNGNANNTVILGDAVNNGKLTFTVSPSLSSSATTYQTNSDVEFTAGFLSSTNGPTKTGAGTLTFSGANLYTGTTIINGGTLVFAKQQALQNSNQANWIPSKFTVSSGTVLALGVGASASGYFDSTALDTFLDGSHMGGSAPASGFNTGSRLGFDTTNATSGTFTYNSDIGNFGTALTNGITKLGAGTMVLGGTNTYTGTTTVSAGTLNLTGNRTAASGAITVTDGATLGISNGNFSLGSNTFTLGSGSGTSTVNHTAGSISFSGGTQLLVGNGAGDGIYYLSGGMLTTAAVANRGIILGVNTGRTGTFTLSDTGTLTMATGSVLEIGRSEGSAATGTTGIFNQTGGTATVGILRMGGQGATTEANTTAELNLSAGIFSADTFTVLSRGNTSSSTINISGTADVTLPEFPQAVSNTLGTSSTAVITFNGGTLKNTAASIDYLGVITSALIKAGGAKFDTTGGNIIILQALQEDGGSTGGGLTKQGTNKLTLSSANTYSGTTTIKAGTLALGASGTFANSPTIVVGDAGSSGAVLDLTAKASFAFGVGQTVKGIGTINIGAGKTVTINGKLAPGNSIGTDAVTGNLTLAGTADFELGNSTGAGSHASPFNGDRTNVSGTLTLGGTLNLLDNAGADSNGSAAGGSYLIFTQSGTASGAFATINNVTGYHAVVNTATSGSVFLDNYQIASANTIATPVNLGNFHVGATATSALSIQNTASNVLWEGLNATIGATTLDATVSGSNINNLAGGATDNTSILVGIDTSTAGSKNGTVTVSLASNGSNSGYSNTSLGSQVITVNGGVYSGQMIWNGGAGTYNVGSNWTDSVIGGAQVAPGLDGGFTGVDTATFNGSGGAVNLDGSNPNLNAITFNNNGNYNLAQGTGGTLTLSGTTPSITVSGTGTGTHEISANVNMAANTTFTTNASSQLTVSGVIGESGGARSLIFNGSGTTILSNTNTYTGTTSVTAGTLQVNGSIAAGLGGVTVSNGATLSGTGTIGNSINAPSITIDSSSALIVGNTHGEGSTASLLTLQSDNFSQDGTGVITLGGMVQFDIVAKGSYTTDGVLKIYNQLGNNDQLKIVSSQNSNLLLSDTAFLDLHVKSSLVGSLLANDAWRLFDWSSFVNADAINRFSNVYGADALGSSVNLLPDVNGLSWNTSRLYTDGIIYLEAAPEPSRAVLMLIGAAGLLMRRKRKGD